MNGTIEILQAISNVSFIHSRRVEWPNNMIKFSLKFQEDLSSDANITYQIRFGDNAVSDFLPLNASNTDENKVVDLISHVYESPGCYMLSIVVRSQINSIILKSNLTISNVEQLSIRLSSEYDRNSTSLFRADYPLKVEIFNSVDSCYLYTYLITNLETNKKYRETTTKSVFVTDTLLNLPGVYRIEVKISTDGLDINISNQNFTLLQGWPTLFLLAGKTTSLQEQHELVILTRSDPSGISNLYWDFGDNTSLVIKPSFLNASREDLVMKYNGNIPFASEVLFFFNISHLYDAERLYTLKVFAENEVSRSEASTNIFVSDIYCERPSVRIACNTEKILTFHYQSHITILSNVRINCKKSKKVLFEWKLYESNQWELENDILSTEKHELRFVIYLCFNDN